MENIKIKKEMTRGIYGTIKKNATSKERWLPNEIKSLFMIIRKMQLENSLIVEIRPSDFGRKITRNNQFDYLDKILSGLQKKDFNLRLDNTKYRKYSLISFLEYDKGESIKVKFNEDLKDLIFNETSFSKINVKELMELKSYYSIIAKILLSNATNLKTFVMDIERFKINFQVPITYRSNDIKVKVIDKIKKEVSEVHDISFKKNGKKITHVAFHLNYNNKVITKKELFNPTLEKSIQKCKRNLYISKAWNGSMDKKIKKIEKEKGLEFTKELLDKLYTSLNSEITTSLVAYTNTIIGTIPVVKKENPSPKKKIFIEKTEKKELTKEEKEEIRRKNKEILKKMRIGG